jgi:hypothetical protein
MFLHHVFRRKVFPNVATRAAQRLQPGFRTSLQVPIAFVR